MDLAELPVSMVGFPDDRATGIVVGLRRHARSAVPSLEADNQTPSVICGSSASSWLTGYTYPVAPLLPEV